MEIVARIFSPRDVNRKLPSRARSIFPPKNKEPQVDALCVNCQEMISETEIDQHSISCYHVHERVFQIENKVNIEQVDYKLDKLKKALANHLKIRDYKNKNEETLIIKIIDFIEKMRKFENQANLREITELKELLDSVQELLENFSGSAFSFLYIERVKFLGREKYRELLKQDQDRSKIANSQEKEYFSWSRRRDSEQPVFKKSSGQEQKRISQPFDISRRNSDNFGARLRQYQRDENINPDDLQRSQNSRANLKRRYLESKLEETRNECSKIAKLVDNYKKQTEDIQNSINFEHFRSPASNPVSTRNLEIENPQTSKTYRSINNIISDISSEVDGRNSLTSIGMSDTQSSGSVLTDWKLQEDLMFEESESADSTKSQELQRLFYSKCLAIKLRFASKDSAQLVPIALIFKDAISNNIPQRNWDLFIENAFRNPEKYIDMKKLRKKDKFGFKNNLAHIAKTKYLK